MTAGREGLLYRRGLDGVRAVAVAGVVLYHGQVLAVAGGFVGVDLFFVLSGFLITSLLLHEHARTKTIDLARFWMARARRLLPASLLVIATSLVVVAIFSPDDLGLLRGDALWSVLYVNNWHQIFDQRSYFQSFGRPSLLQHYWSLSLEEQFYLVWPPLLLVGLRWAGRRGTLVLVLVAAACSTLLAALLFDPTHDPSRIYYGTDTRATPILIGVALAFVWPSMTKVAPVRPGARVLLDLSGLLGLTMVVWAMLTWHDYEPEVYRGGLALLAFGAALLIASASHPATLVGRVLGVSPLVWIGRRSYGIYLWHWPIMAMSRPDVDVHMSLNVLVPLQVALTLVLAELSYRYVEMPIRRQDAQRTARLWLLALVPSARRTVVLAVPALAVLFVVLVAAWPATESHLASLPTASAQAHAVPQPLPPPPRPRPAVLPARGVTTPTPTTTPAPASPATATTTTTPAHAHHAEAAPRGPVLAVGASVMLAAINALHHRLHASVDGEVGRQPEAIVQRLQAYRARDALPPVVVVQIGENGPLDSSILHGLRSVLQGVPRVILVTMRYPGASWIAPNNDDIVALAKRWPQATIADWADASGDPSLTYDGAHPNPAGAKVYASVVAKAIDR